MLAALARCRSFRGLVVVPALSIAHAWGMAQALVGREPVGVGQEAATNAVTTGAVDNLRRFDGCRRMRNLSPNFGRSGTRGLLYRAAPMLAPTHDPHRPTAALTSITQLPHHIKVRFATLLALARSFAVLSGGGSEPVGWRWAVAAFLAMLA